MADRLANEYGLECVFEPSPYAEARWLGGDAAKIEDFASKYRAQMGADIDEAPVFLGKSGWEINYVAERFPDVSFQRTKERG
jgi:peptide chain release factor 3